MAPKAANPDTTLLQLDPTKVLAEDNIRFATQQADVDMLKENILKVGGVLEPIIVEILNPPLNGYGHKVRMGFRRHQAVLELNAQGAGLTLPAVLRSGGNLLEEQISENLQRKNLTPMDLAVAIQKAFAAGLTRLQIREMFPRPGGKKGQIEPASNAWVNMTLSFLELPKAIQMKIADGTVGVKAAYELTKVSPDKRAAVLERAEADAQKERDREDSDEKKYLAQTAKLDEATKLKEETAIKLDAARKEMEEAGKFVENAQKVAAEKYIAAKTAKGDDKKAAEEAFKAAETDAKGVEKKLLIARKEFDKLNGTSKKATEAADAQRKKLEDARANAKKTAANKKTVSDTDVKKAAKAEGATTNAVPLNAADMRKTISDLALPGTYPKVQAIGAALKSCFDGVDTPGQMLKKLAAITGEAVETPKKKK